MLTTIKLKKITVKLPRNIWKMKYHIYSKNKSTASIIPCHSNYLFMYRCENVWKENDGGTDNNPKPDLDNINGLITILN